jgi:hypothetical protein
LLLVATLTFSAAGCGGDAGGFESVARTTAAPDQAPLLLVLHSGGFILGKRHDVQEAMDRAAELGFKPVYVDYPLGDLPAAVRYTNRVARREADRGRPLYAYGESAGGTLAALLSTRGLTKEAATYSQITSLTRYTAHTQNPMDYKALISATNRDLRRFSPGHRHAKTRLMALAPVADSPYLTGPTNRWAERESRVTSLEVAGGHLAFGDKSLYTENMNRALEWLAGRAGLGTASP